MHRSRKPSPQNTRNSGAPAIQGEPGSSAWIAARSAGKLT